MKEIELKYGEARKRARLNWARSEHGKTLTRTYMKEYRSRPHVKAKYHEYYVKNKQHWGEITKAKQRKANGYDSSWYKDEDLHAINSERFTNYEK